MSFSNLPISYCANVHPGESFARALAGIRTYAAPVARALRERENQPIAVGPWMTAAAIAELESPGAPPPALVGLLEALIADAGLVVYTMNAFPFGNFHARRVKETVYLPDWTTTARLEFTLGVARLLARLLPDDTEGSISTSPCAFKAAVPAGSRPEIFFPMLLRCARELARLRDRTGRTIRLAIEPEPGCVLETTPETIAFFETLWRHAANEGIEPLTREHLGVCFDVCHQAVEFEDLGDSVAALAAAGIRVNKVHVTCALELDRPGDPAARAHLARFAEERYLHQTFARHPSGRMLSILDLTAEHANFPPAAWLEAPAWRVHFHVPVYRDRIGPLKTTRPALSSALRQVGQLPYAPHLEVETYTWSVMPGADSPEHLDLVSELVRELSSALDIIQELKGPNPGPAHG